MKHLQVICLFSLFFSTNVIIAQKVEDEGKCRFAVIPDGIVEVEDEYEENDMDEA